MVVVVGTFIAMMGLVIKKRCRDSFRGWEV
jgi:hypothetical protein